MKKQFLIAMSLMLALTGCSPAKSSTPATDETSNEVSADTTEESSDENSESDAEEMATAISVDKGLFNVTLHIPADFIDEETTQEDLDAIAQEEGFKSVTLNEDGSVTYVINKEQHKQLMDEVVSSINDGIADIVRSEDYPDVSSITANDDFTNFTISIDSSEVGLSESMLVLVMYVYGGMYNAYNGTAVDNIHVDFVNADTGEIMESGNSSDMEE